MATEINPRPRDRLTEYMFYPFHAKTLPKTNCPRFLNLVHLLSEFWHTFEWTSNHLFAVDGFIELVCRFFEFWRAFEKKSETGLAWRESSIWRDRRARVRLALLVSAQNMNNFPERSSAVWWERKGKGKKGNSPNSQPRRKKNLPQPQLILADLARQRRARDAQLASDFFLRGQRVFNQGAENDLLLDI